MKERIGYGLFEIEVTYLQGIGSFNSPLTNTPYGYAIFDTNNHKVRERIKSNSTKEGAIRNAMSAIDYGWIK